MSEKRMTSFVVSEDDIIKFEQKAVAEKVQEGERRMSKNKKLAQLVKEYIDGKLDIDLLKEQSYKEDVKTRLEGFHLDNKVFIALEEKLIKMQKKNPDKATLIGEKANLYRKLVEWYLDK